MKRDKSHLSSLRVYYGGHLLSKTIVITRRSNVDASQKQRRYDAGSGRRTR